LGKTAKLFPNDVRKINHKVVPQNADFRIWLHLC